MATCDNCERHVTRDYERVFADNEGTIHHCPNCAPRGAWQPEGRV